MLNSDFRDMLCAFNGAGVEYLVVGAYAMAAHGLPRATGDIDLWVRPAPDNALRVIRALSQFGALTHGISSADFEKPDLVFQIGIAPRRIDLLTAIDGVSFDEAVAGSTAIEFDGISVLVLGRAELIKNKRASGRPKDLADVAWLLEPGGDANIA